MITMGTKYVCGRLWLIEECVSTELNEIQKQMVTSMKADHCNKHDWNTLHEILQKWYMKKIVEKVSEE